MISDLGNHTTKLLFTSGVPENENKKFGGGIYELLLEGIVGSTKIYTVEFAMA